MRRTAVLVDGINFRYMCRAVIGEDPLNYNAILYHIAALTNSQIVKAYYYVSEPTDHVVGSLGPFERILHAIRHAGFHARQKKIKSRLNGDGTRSGKANHDVEIATDAMRLVMSREVDQVVLVSGDGDFIYLAEELKRQDARIIIAALTPCNSHNSTSLELTRVANQFLDLTTVIPQWRHRSTRPRAIPTQLASTP